MSNRTATVLPADGLRLRKEPTTTSEIRGLLLKGAVVTITARQAEWRQVDSTFGPGFVHGDFISVDGVTPVNQEPPGLDPEVPAHDQKPADDRTGGGATAAEFYTVLPDDSLTSIGTKLGLDWREIAAVNGIAAPFTISANQVLRLPAGGVRVGTIELLNPVKFDGATLVTSSSAQGHHTPYGGNRSADLDVSGAESIGQPIAFNVAAPEGLEVRGVVTIIGPACRSGELSDGGRKVQIRIEHRAAGGEFADSGAWVLYAHLDPVLVKTDDVLPVGTTVGLMGPAAAPEFNSSCAQGSHVHIEAIRGTWVAQVGASLGTNAVIRIGI